MQVQSLAEVCLPGVPVLRATKQALLRGREELLPALSAAAAGTEATAARQARVAAGAGMYVYDPTLTQYICCMLATGYTMSLVQLVSW